MVTSAVTSLAMDGRTNEEEAILACTGTSWFSVCGLHRSGVL